MPDFVVKTAFRTKDEMSKTFKRMGLSGNRFTKNMIKNFGRVERKALSTRRIIGGILGAAVIQRSLGLLQQGVRGVVTEFIDFEDAITAASAKFGILDRKSPAFKALGETAREVGATTEFTSAQAAEGLRFLAKAGWEANAAMRALPSFVDLATASEMEFARAADIATDVMGAFRLRSDDVEENMRQLVRVNDVLSKAVNMSNIDMEDLFETIKFAGPIAKTAGVSLEQFSAMAAFIGGAGIKGSLGGTALRTMFLNLVAPTDAVKGKLAEFNTELKNVDQIKNNRKQLKALGIEIDELGNLSPIETLKKLSERMKDLGPTAKAAALNVIFGKRAVSGAAVSMDGATGSLQKFEKQLVEAGGTSKQMAAFMRGSIGKRMAELKSAAIELGFKFIDTFEKDIPGGISAAIKAVREFDIKPVIEAVKEAASAAKSFIEIIREYKGILIGAAAGFAALKIGGFIAAFAELVAVALAFKAAGGFVAIFAGVAAAVGPLAAAALAIGGVTAAILTLHSHWDELGVAIKWLVDDMKTWFLDLSSVAQKAIKAIVNSIPVIGPLAKALLPQGMPEAPRESQRKSARQGAPPPLADLVREGAASAKKRLKAPAKVDPEIQKLAEGAARSQKMLSDFKALKEKYSAPPAPRLENPESNKRVVPPNQKAEQSKRQRIQFEGQLDIAGAPQGSQVTSKTRGAPPVRTSMLGAN